MRSLLGVELHMLTITHGTIEISHNSLNARAVAAWIKIMIFVDFICTAPYQVPKIFVHPTLTTSTTSLPFG